jgi:hypothetical protein
MQMHARRRRRHHPLHFSASRYGTRRSVGAVGAHSLAIFAPFSFLGRRGDVHLSEQVNHANAPAIYSAARVSRADFATAEMSGIESRAVCVLPIKVVSKEQTHSPAESHFLSLDWQIVIALQRRLYYVRAIAVRFDAEN